MTAVPLLPKNAPFSPEEIGVLNKVVSRTTPLQRSWLAGFFAGFEAVQGALAAPAAALGRGRLSRSSTPPRVAMPKASP